MKKDAYYFSHDSNARNDIKIKALIRNYGLEGYGRFWVIIELLREQSDYQLQLDEFTYETLAEELRTGTDQVENFIDNCIYKYKLFETNGESFWSASLLTRMDKMNKIREKRIEAGKRSAEARLKKK